MTQNSSFSFANFDMKHAKKCRLNFIFYICLYYDFEICFPRTDEFSIISDTTSSGKKQKQWFLSNIYGINFLLLSYSKYSMLPSCHTKGEVNYCSPNKIMLRHHDTFINCKQCGMKRSAEAAERVTLQPAAHAVPCHWNSKNKPFLQKNLIRNLNKRYIL